MKKNTLLKKLLIFLCCFISASYGFATKVVDLTHPVGEGTIQWPTASRFHVSNEFAALVKDGGYWYESRDFSQAEHSGTHTDAPAHFFQRQVAHSGYTSRDIPEKSIVIVHTGRGSMYSDKQQYFGRPEHVTDDQDVENLHFPGISPEAATWLTMKRNVVGVAIDTPSTDRGQSKKFLTHQVLGKHNVWGLENLANSDQLPPRGFTVYNMVHKLDGGSGGPTRVVAVLDHEVVTGGARCCYQRIWFTFAASFLLMYIFRR